MNWALFPLMLQAVYVAAVIPPLLRLIQSKRSDQHAVSNQFLSLGAHFAMTAWAWLYAGQVGLVASSLISIVTTSITLGTILYYRGYPGGRPKGLRVRADRRPAYHSPGARAAGSFRPVIG